MARYELEFPLANAIQPQSDQARSVGPKQRIDSAHSLSRSTSPRLDWWREARFGMFLHWGLYAIPAGIWRGQRYKFIGEWIMQQAKIPIHEYERLAAEFDPKQYDPQYWVDLAVKSGVKYLVITAKHHDGFAMYDSACSDWNVVKQTPYGKDLIAPLAKACAESGLKLGFYYSQDLDWHHPDGAGNDWDYPDHSVKNIDRYLEKKVKPQIRELLTNYGPVALLWFDTPVSFSEQQSLDLAEYVHQLQPECLVSGRIGHNAGDYGSLEDNSIPNGSVKGDWEMPATMNETWGYKSEDENWKSPRKLIQQLADLASKGANYLLNIGPDANGCLPQPSEERMQVIGNWLKTNGEAIYGTTASPYPYSFSWGSITQSPGKLYLLIENWPNAPIQLPGLLNQVSQAYVIGEPDKLLTYDQKYLGNDTAKLKISTTNINLPALPPDPYVSCVVLEINGPVKIDSTLVQDKTNRIVLPSQVAKVQNKSESAIAGIGFSGLIEKWKSTKTVASWNFAITLPGTYHVWVTSGTVAAHEKWRDSHHITLLINGQTLAGELTPDKVSESKRAYYFPEYSTLVGKVSFADCGKFDLTLTADKINEKAPDGLCVAEIRLELVS